MSFGKQVRLAKAKSYNSKFKRDAESRSFYRSRSFPDLRRTVRKPSFGSFASKAYKAKDGYALRTNRKTGKKEMFVRGTTFKRGGVEWLQNVAESPLSSLGGLGGAISGDVSRHIRGKYSKFLSGVAKKEGVDVIYGHSRGAAVVEDMRVPGASKYGLDGATILNRRSTITNYRQRQFFDAGIGLNNRATIKENRWTPIYKKRYHRVWG